MQDRERVIEHPQLLLNRRADLRRARDPFAYGLSKECDQRSDNRNERDNESDGGHGDRDTEPRAVFGDRAERNADNKRGDHRQQRGAAQIKRRDERNKAHQQGRQDGSEPPERRNAGQRLRVGELQTEPGAFGPARPLDVFVHEGARGMGNNAGTMGGVPSHGIVL